VEDKRQKLLDELEKYEKKILQLRTDCAEFKAGGSRYGDEYGEMQVKVYTQMIEDVKTELKKFKT
jgi:flagellar biosynthesis/type III secretory pathway protein FliH